MVGLISYQLLILTLVASHPVPDGLVFRGIQVVVHSDKLEIRYQVGLSDAMIRRELNRIVGWDTNVSEMGGAEALARYRDMMFPQLSRRLKVAIEGRPVELIPQRADIVRQPHAQLEFVYAVALRLTSEPQRFDLLDENYSGVPGYHLAAMRGRGNAQVVPAGSQELFARLPSIPEATEVEAAPLQSVRKIEAFIRSTQPVTDLLATEPVLALEAAEATTGNVATPSDVTAMNREEVSVDRPAVASDASSRSTDPQTSLARSEPAVATDASHIFWCVSFGGLAVLIALAWLRSSRKDHRR